jgi:hypothetical protein
MKRSNLIDLALCLFQPAPMILICREFPYFGSLYEMRDYRRWILEIHTTDDDEIGFARSLIEEADHYIAQEVARIAATGH